MQKDRCTMARAEEEPQRKGISEEHVERNANIKLREEHISSSLRNDEVHSKMRVWYTWMKVGF